MINDMIHRNVCEVVRRVLPDLEDPGQVAREIVDGLVACGLLRGRNRHGTFDLLPQDVIDHLVCFRAAALEDPAASQRLNYYLHQLHAAGWTLESLGTALGVTRERVRQRIGKAGRVEHDAPVISPPPPPPPPDLPAAPPPRLRKVPDETARELRRLQAQAVRYRGHTAADSPVAQAARELSALMHRLVTNEKHTVSAVARAAGVTPSAVRLRLSKWGYRHCPPSCRPVGVRAGHPAA